MDSVYKAPRAIPDAMPRQAGAEGIGDRAEQEIPTKLKKKDTAETAQQQAWDDLVSTGLSSLNKLGQTLLGEAGQPQQPGAKAFSGLTIETDKATGQRHLKLPMPKKETLQGIANLLNDFVRRRYRCNQLDCSGWCQIEERIDINADRICKFEQICVDSAFSCH